MRAPDQQSVSGVRRDARYWRAVIGLSCYVVMALLVLSVVTIGAFALLYGLAHLIAPEWAFLSTLAGRHADHPGDLLNVSQYVFFHATPPAPLVPHGPERVLIWLEFTLSWAWIILVGAWAINRWRALEVP